MKPSLELHLLLLLSAAHLLPGGAQAAAVVPQDCGGTFQSQLQQLLTTKRSCDSAAFYDCCQVKNLVPLAPTGEYVLRKFTGQPLEPFSSNTAYTTLKARCDMDTDGGGWMVIQRRVPNGTTNFTRSWEDYENGFGDLSGEFWYGLRNIHLLTARDEVELHIDMVKSDGGSLTWTYQTFTVAGGGDKYRLTIGGGEGVGSDAMANHNGMQFTTYDQDNDQYSDNCAYHEQGAWWYNSCYNTNPNGPHNTPSWAGVDQRFAKILWYNGSAWQLLSSVEMKIRVKNCVQGTQDC